MKKGLLLTTSPPQIHSKCTDAVSVDMEEHLYNLAEESGITIITISQRAALTKHHDHELKLLGNNGSWQLHKRK